MCFFEGASRVPLMVSAPQMPPGLIETPVSLIDVCPTLCDLAGIGMDEVSPWTGGESLVPLAQGRSRETPVAMEYAAETSPAPMVCLRQGRWKYTRCALDPDQLFDLETDPDELTDLAGDPAHGETLARFRAMADARWDLDAFDAAVRESQARRRVVGEALRQGGYAPWDFQPFQNASERYMRNHMDLNIVEKTQRYPRGD